MAARKRHRASTSKKVVLSSAFCKRFDELRSAALSTSIEQVVKDAIGLSEHAHRVWGRAMTLGDLARVFLPHVNACLEELARVGGLRFLPDANAYLPGRVSDEDAAGFDVEGNGGPRGEVSRAKLDQRLGPALERLARTLPAAASDGGRSGAPSRRARSAPERRRSRHRA